MGRKIMGTLFLMSFILLQACNNNYDSNYVYWTKETANQIERLNDAGVQYKIQNGEVWVNEKDVNNVVQCCS